MFNLFKKKANRKRVEEYIKTHEKEYAEFEAAMQLLRDERSKAKFVIKQIYAQHNIDTGDSWDIYEYCLDSEAFTDLCIFSDAEIASLLKWTQRYKELDTEMTNLFNKYYCSNARNEGYKE